MNDISNSSPLLSRPAVMRTSGVTKSYPMGDGRDRLDVLRGIDLEVGAGEAVAILGSSGTGKSTLLHILGTLDRPSLGRVFFKDRDLTRATDAELAEIRLNHLGFVFQFHHLLAEFSAEENVMMPARIAGENLKEAMDRARALLEQFGLADRRKHHPTEMSGGEQQRVAIARALMMRPEVLLADEPTGNLDTVNAGKIQDLFFELKERHNLTLIVVTHDLSFASRFPRTLKMRDGVWQPQ
jgi:lipoprotein-releasing system ATP-binding protein